MKSAADIALIHPATGESDLSRDTAAPVYGYSGYPLINANRRMNISSPSKVSAQSDNALRQQSMSPPASYSGQYSDTAAVLTLSSHKTASMDRGEIINASVPRTRVVQRDELISQFGNLIDGADPNKPASSVSAVQTSTSGPLTALSEKITRMDEQTKLNTKQLDEIVKKQKEFDAVTLKTSDVQQLSDEVLNKLKTQLRLDRSRYS